MIYRKLDTDTRIFFYEQEFYVLSNFSAFQVHWEGRIFATSEHLYQWLKFDWCENEKMALLEKPAGTFGLIGYVRDDIAHAPSAHDAYKIAQAEAELVRPDWQRVRVEKMEAILWAKQDQHEYVHRKLMETGDRELIEDSWRDPFWGWGPNKDGENMLGKLWMKIRSQLRAHG